MSNAQHTVNKVINLPRSHSWEYRYEVQGCIFTIEKTMSGTWVMYGYASLKDEQECNYFEEWADSKKKYCTHFLKFTFERNQYI